MISNLQLYRGSAIVPPLYRGNLQFYNDGFLCMLSHRGLVYVDGDAMRGNTSQVQYKSIYWN